MTDAPAALAASAIAKPRSYTGCCSVCGKFSVFRGYLRSGPHPREQFACASCGATLRYRDQATAILQQFAGGRALHLDDFVQTAASGLAILEFGLKGPFVPRLGQLAGYRQAYFFECVPIGKEKDGVRCEDIRRTTFADGTFDLIITSDVMEHVAGWRQAVAEVARLLAPGGAHVFTVPLAWPLRPQSRTRAEVVDGEVVHHLEPRHHVSGTGGSTLVFTDFGRDLVDCQLAEGLDARFFNGHMMLDGLHTSPAVVAVKAGARMPVAARAGQRPRSQGVPGTLAGGVAGNTDAAFRERPNRVRCVVCGWRDILAGADPLLADCPVCRATIRTMHLAAALLALASRGMRTTLGHFAGRRNLGGHRVLDLTGDAVVRMACRLAADYCARGLAQATECAAEEIGVETAAAVSGLEPESADIVLLRDVLQLVPDLAAFVADVRCLLRPGGAVVFQDRFTLPLPPQTGPAGEDDWQLVVRERGELAPGIVKLRVPVRRRLGADFIDVCATHGLAATVDLPPAPSLLAHRHPAIVARCI